jgi:hypothetical protein
MPNLLFTIAYTKRMLSGWRGGLQMALGFGEVVAAGVIGGAVSQGIP